MRELFQHLAGVEAGRGLYLHEDFFGPARFVPYAEFPARIAASAAHFRAHGVRPGERILFPFETSEEVIFSFLGLMELGALPFSVKPYILSTPKQGYRDFLSRLSSHHGVQRVLGVPSLQSIELPLERVPLAPSGSRVDGAVLREAPGDELAFVQFSSGSTSFPKGVPITWRNLTANLRMILSHDGRTGEDRGMSWLPLYHDMGLIGGLLTCVHAGHDIRLSQPATFLLDPLGWLEFLSEHRATLGVIPNFAIDYSLKQLQDADAEQLARLDLSALRSVYLGSEPINLANLEDFVRRLAPQGLRGEAFKPCYGMAEAVLMVSCTPMERGWRVVEAPNGQPAVSVGPVLSEFEARLRGEDGHLCGERELGEVELRGGSLAAEYYADSRTLRGEEGFYATGDLGFMDGGELFITGRAGDRIKLNGQSYFSSDFEQAVERLPFIRPGRTVALHTGGRVVVLAEVNAASALERLEQSRRHVCDVIQDEVGVKVLPEDVLFIRYGQLQKTSSGKLQRRAMLDAYEAGRVRTVTPRELRADLVRMRAQRLLYGSVYEAQRRSRALVGRGRQLVQQGWSRLRRKLPGVSPN
ncbi:AMP-binding protein [Myxococcaceae bacterium GXIMD 01537]